MVEPKFGSFSTAYKKFPSENLPDCLHEPGGWRTFAAALKKAVNTHLFFILKYIRHVDTLSYRTESVSRENAERKWYVIDAENQVAGRLCSRIATILRGKNKPSYTPHADTGDYVVVINASKVRFTGKKWDQKEYKDYSHWPGGQKLTLASEMLTKDARRIIERGVKGMLPKNTLGRQMVKKLFVYSEGEHPHSAQKPEMLSFDKPNS